MLRSLLRLPLQQIGQGDLMTLTQKQVFTLLNSFTLSFSGHSSMFAGLSSSASFR